MSGEKLSVGPPYFNSAAGPIVLVLVAAMAIGPLIKWRRDKAREVLNRVAIPILISAMALFALILFAPGIGLFPLLGLTLAAGVAAASVAPPWNRHLHRKSVVQGKGVSVRVDHGGLR